MKKVKKQKRRERDGVAELLVPKTSRRATGGNDIDVLYDLLTNGEVRRWP